MTEITDDATNKYLIHSVKLDAALPFSSFRIDAGAAFTGIRNVTDIHISNFINGNWINDPNQSNSFNYIIRNVRWLCIPV